MVAHCHVVRCVTVLYIVPRMQSETVYDSVAEQHSEEKQNGLWHSWHSGTPRVETRRGTQCSAGRITLHQGGGGMAALKLHKIAFL